MAGARFAPRRPPGDAAEREVPQPDRQVGDRAADLEAAEGHERRDDPVRAARGQHDGQQSRPDRGRRLHVVDQALRQRHEDREHQQRPPVLDEVGRVLQVLVGRPGEPDAGDRPGEGEPADAGIAIALPQERIDRGEQRERHARHVAGKKGLGGGDGGRGRRIQGAGSGRADMIARRGCVVTTRAMKALKRAFAANMCRIWHGEARSIRRSGRAGVLQFKK